MDFQIKNIDCVYEQSEQFGGLYIGNMYSTEDEYIKKHNIGAIVTAVYYANIVEDSIVKRLFLQLDDIPSENIDSHFDRCIGFIRQCRLQKLNVLVHCLGGISRSSTLILAYMMYTSKQSLVLCLQQLKQIRPIVKPNSGFMRQLELYDEKNQMNLMNIIS